ncbi:MAG TPA: O-antigen ligase family protein [Acidothermaceae bacterium]
MPSFDDMVADATNAEVDAPNAPESEPWPTAFALAAPLLTLLVVGVIRKGAFFRPDIVVAPALAVALALSIDDVRGWLRAHLPTVAAITIGTGWWIASALVWRHSVNTWELPAAWLSLLAGYACARTLSPQAKRVALVGVALAGLALAVAALVVIGVHSTAWTFLDERSLRFSGPFTYPSAAGLFFVMAMMAGATAADSRSPVERRIMTIGASVVVLGVVSTDSRGAVLGIGVMLCFRTLRHRLRVAVLAAIVAAPLLLIGQRADSNRLLVVGSVVVAVALAFVPDGVAIRALYVIAVPAFCLLGWLLVTQHHVVSGLDASWAERGNVLRGAIHVFAAHPTFGAGPDPLIPAHTLTGQPGIAYFAHNEPVEVLISVGSVGTGVLVLCAGVVVRAARAYRTELAVPALVTAFVAGTVDFVWHFPALGLAVGIVAGAGALRSARGTPDPELVDPAADTVAR